MQRSHKAYPRGSHRFPFEKRKLASNTRTKDTGPGDMACRNCYGLSMPETGGATHFPLELIPPETPVYLTMSLEELKDTAHSGCPVCTFLLNGVTSFCRTPEEISEISLEMPSSRVHVKRKTLRVGIVLGFGDHATRKTTPWMDFRTFDVRSYMADISLEFYTDSKTLSSSFPALAIMPHVSPDNSGPECSWKMKQWLEKCVLSHSRRCPSGEPKKLPTRVIAVGDLTTDPCLYEPSAGETGQYAALSYCWGEGSVFKATSSTYLQLKSGFNIERLPKTCGDAIRVARGLEIPYLWIDSLCIIQDSSSDWQHESEMMCSIYENALVTFAGLDSPDSNAGLFMAGPGRGTKTFDIEAVKENGKWTKPSIPGAPGLSQTTKCSDSATKRIMDQKRECLEEFPQADSGIIAGRVYVREYYQAGPDAVERFCFHAPATRNRATFLRPNILLERGWTLQEIKLSPRVLFFSGWEVAWRCTSVGACECTGGGTPIGTSESFTNRGLEIANTPPMSERITRWKLSNSGERENYLIMWHEIVEIFTQKKLSFMSDRLPAIAGLAGKLQSQLNCRYLCGMWETNIERSLLWESCSPYPEGDQQIHPAHRVISEQYAPSWTWASVTGAVSFRWTTFMDWKLQFCWRFLKIQFNAAGNNIFGPGQGSIELESLIVPLEIEKKETSNNTEHDFTITVKGPFGFSENSTVFFQDQRHPYHDIQCNEGKKLFCLIAGYMVREGIPETMAGLMVEEVNEIVEVPKFKRRGLIKVDLYANPKRGPSWWHLESAGERRRIVLV